MSGGYVGEYAVVDLSSGSIQTVALTDDFYRKYLGVMDWVPPLSPNAKKPALIPSLRGLTWVFVPVF
jgi:hypothetical protein